MNVFTDWLTKEDQMDLLTQFDYHFIPLTLPKDYNKTMAELKFEDSNVVLPPMPTLSPNEENKFYTLLYINDTNSYHDNSVITKTYIEPVKLELGDKMYIVLHPDRNPETHEISIAFLKYERTPKNVGEYPNFESKHPANYGFDITSSLLLSNWLHNGVNFWVTHYGDSSGFNYHSPPPENPSTIMKGYNNTMYFLMTVLAPCTIEFYIMNIYGNPDRKGILPICYEEIRYFTMRDALAESIVHQSLKRPEPGRIFVKFDTTIDYVDNNPTTFERGNPFFSYNHKFRESRDHKVYGGARPFGFQESRVLRDYMISIRHRVEAVFLLFSPLGFKNKDTEAITFPYGSTQDHSPNFEDLNFLAEQWIKKINEEFPANEIGVGQSSWYLSEFQYGRFDDWIHTLINFKPVFNLNFYYTFEGVFDDTKDKLEEIVLNVEGALREIIKEMAWGKYSRVRRNRYRTIRHNPFPVVND